MSKLAIIPARGGSKRIPRKNIKPFFGKPILAYSIEAAIKSKLFDEIMVSTDDEEIALIASKYGASIPFLRSNKNADEFATTFDVIEEVINSYKKLGKIFETVCCLYPCAPFITDETLIISYQHLISNKFDSVFPIMPFSFPIQRSLKLNLANRVSFFYPEYSNVRSQDLEKSYHDAGQFYWIQVERCLNQKSLLTENTGSIIISEIEGQDIDNEMDWKLAELKYELLQSIK